MTKPFIELRPHLQIELEGTEEALLQKLFDGYEYVVIEQEFDGGFGGSHVFLVALQQNGIRLADFVVKIGAAANIDDEKERYLAYVVDSLPMLAANMIRFASDGLLGAIAYNYIGGNILGKETRSLRDYYYRHPADQVLKVLERLLVTSLGQSWYDQPRFVSRPLYFGEFYGRHFPPDLTLDLHKIRLSPWPSELAGYHLIPTNAPPWKYRKVHPHQKLQLQQFQVERIKGNYIDLLSATRLIRIRAVFQPSEVTLPLIKPEQQVWLCGQVSDRQPDQLERITTLIFAATNDAQIDTKTITLAGDIYPNPLQLYHAYLDKVLPSNLSLIHGDLHCFNVLVDESHKPWLIDFGRVQEGHTLFDFVELETHLRHAILGDDRYTIGDLVGFERRLLCATIVSHSLEPPSNPALAKAFTIIRGIRDFATHYLARRHHLQDEYFSALFLYTLSTLKHYQQNKLPSARHAFIAATILAAFLNQSLNCEELPLSLSITDPTLDRRVYYLKKADGDRTDQQMARQQIFLQELQQAADALRQWLNLPPEQISWDENSPANATIMVRRYGSDLWEDANGQTWGRLVAYEMNDTYLLRLILGRSDQVYSPEKLADLLYQLAWEPSKEQEEWLGQHLVYTCLSSAPAVQLAHRILGANPLQHSQLICGELYTSLTSHTPYLLICATLKQDKLAADFFDRVTPQLGWYTCKALRQEERYQAYFHPQVQETTQKKIPGIIKEAQTQLEHLNQGQTDDKTVLAFHEQRHALEIALLEYKNQLTQVKDILATVKINVENYPRVIQLGGFLAYPTQDEVFLAQQRHLALLPERVNQDLEYWQRDLERYEHDLDIFRLTAKRFPLSSH
jgi:hypothetical protein